MARLLEDGSNRLLEDGGVRLVEGEAEGPPLWTPEYLSHTGLWYDFADASTLTLSGSTITGVADKSPNSRDGAGGTSEEPTLLTAELNGLDVSRFVGGDNIAVDNDLNNMPSAAVFYILKNDADPSVSSTRSGLHRYNYYNSVTHYPYTDGSIYDAFGTTARKSAGNPPQPLNQWHMYHVESYTGRWRNRINGVQRYTTTSNTFAWNHPDPLIGRSSSGHYYEGNIAEVVIIEAQLMTTNERERVEGYLMWKWGLEASLPSGHTYENAAPVYELIITEHPANAVVVDEDTAVFTVAVGSPVGTPTYQWYETTAGLLVGETSSTLSFTVALADDGLSYYCEVNDDIGSATSNTATLTVTKIPLVITAHPQDQFPLDGGPVTFTAGAAGKAPVSYQWYETTAGLLGGETTNTLSFTAALVDNGNTYYIIATDGYSDPLQSNSGLMTIVEAPVITTDPQDAQVIEFRDHTFTIVATGNMPFVYDWYRVGTGLVAADNGPSYTVDPLFPADDGSQYYVVVTDTYNHPATSATATLTVRDANHPDTGTFIDADIMGPTDVTVPYGQAATFSITMGNTVSTPPYTVDWYNDVNGLVYPNGGLSVQHSPTLDEDGSQWWAVVLDDAGLYGQSGLATMAIVPAQLELSWSMENGRPDTTVVAYQSIAWSLYDALTDDRDGQFTCPVRTYRAISNEDGRTYWIPFYDLSARCQRGPLVNDTHNRYYWTQDGQGLRYDTFQNLEWNQFTEGYDVGVPAPAKVPAVAAPNIESTDDVFVTRAYVYTYVTVYGEEGPPSNPTTADGVDGGIWRITNMLTGPDDEKRRLLAKKNIYRTVPGQTGTAEFHYVGSVGINTLQYIDRALDTDIAETRIMESQGWFPPPENLSGLTAHPNGFFIGYDGRDIHFSEPYRPHAWNPDYTVSTLGDVVGFGIFGTTVVVCTTSFPYTITGINPAAMVVTQHDAPEPCLSRYGIVSMPFGVYYPGPNGLMLASPQGFQNATQNLMTKEEWQNRYQVKTFDAAQYQSQYVAFYTPVKGIMFAPDEPMAALVDLDLASGQYEPDQIDSIFTDEYSGKTYLLSNCDMYEWNPVSGANLEFDWTSMEFDAADPVNFGASRIIWYSNYTPPSEEETWAWRIFNTSRIAAAPLAPMNFSAVNKVRVIDNLVYDLTVLDAYPEINQTVVQEYLDNFEQIKQAFHWGPLVWVPAIGAKWPNTPYVIMELIANGKVVYTSEISDTQIFRLPSGFKSTRFKIRLRSNINIQSVKVAETGRELAGF